LVLCLTPAFPVQPKYTVVLQLQLTALSVYYTSLPQPTLYLAIHSSTLLEWIYFIKDVMLHNCESRNGCTTKQRLHKARDFRKQFFCHFKALFGAMRYLELKRTTLLYNDCAKQTCCDSTLLQNHTWHFAQSSLNYDLEITYIKTAPFSHMFCFEIHCTVL
jgi:hypothetical protein